MALYHESKGGWGSSAHRLTRADADTFRLEYREESNTGRPSHRSGRQFMTPTQAIAWGQHAGYDAETVEALEVESCGF